MVGPTAEIGTSDDPSLSFVEVALEEQGLVFHILENLDERSRQNCILLNRTFCDLLTSDGSFLWRLERLHAEYGIYAPAYDSSSWSLVAASPTIISMTVPHKQVFLEYFSRRHFWMNERNEAVPTNGATTHRSSNNGIPNNNSDEETFQISVSVRFKPKADKSTGTNSSSNTMHERKVTLPLHQRLALIRMSRNLSSNQEAMTILKEQGGFGFSGRNKANREESRKRSIDDTGEGVQSSSGSFFVSAANNESSYEYDDTDLDKENSNIYRALDSSLESKDGNEAVLPSLIGGLHTIDSEKNRLIVVDPTKGLREFPFHNVLPDQCGQDYSYDSIAKKLVCDFLGGHNATCMVYGQTGAGKTFTMFGPSGALQGDNHIYHLAERSSRVTSPRRPPNSAWGIIPRACWEIFEAVNFRSNPGNLKNPIRSKVAVSYVEIFGNQVLDLLRKGKLCGHNATVAQRYVLDGGAEKPVEDFGQLMDYLRVGEEQKRIAATALNERSSRAHSLFIVTLEQDCPTSSKTVKSKLFLADLGGSEQLKKSQANNSSNRAERQARTLEAANINLDLLRLKQVVEALQVSKKKRQKGAYIPYAGSKLTMLLSQGLGGDSKTNIVICGSQDVQHTAETLAAIQFGQACARISRKSRKRRSQERMLHDIIEDIDKKIKDCEERIRQDERWENRQEKRSDGYGGYELRTTTRLVGAEVQREELEVLLKRRAELTGTNFDLRPVSKPCE